MKPALEWLGRVTWFQGYVGLVVPRRDADVLLAKQPHPGVIEVLVLGPGQPGREELVTVYH